MKRKKKHYIEYDYENQIVQQYEKEEEDTVLRLLKDGVISHCYATKEIFAGNQLDVEIYPEFTRKESASLKQKLKKKTKKAIKDLNDKNARKYFARLVNTNFTDDDYCITLTYTPESQPQDYESAHKDITNFLRRLNRQRKKQGMPNAKYVYVTEKKKNGYHHHIIVDSQLELTMKEVNLLWGKSRRNDIKLLDTDEFGLTGIAFYLAKDPQGRKRWGSSRGLKKPTVKKNHYKFKRKDIRQAISCEYNLIDKLKKLYPQYTFTDVDIRYNEINAMFYIYARLRL